MAAGRFLTAEWRDLAMLNYEIDPALLASRVPAGCELDAWQGRTFVSVVGFRFLRTRVLGVPIPFHRSFEEVNLRFYIRRRGEEGWRRGVVFVKELVPRRAIAWVARSIYGENYVAYPMQHARRSSSRADRASVHYQWRRAGTWESVSASFSGRPDLPADGSDEAFITEHYWGYSRLPDGGTVEYQVEHPRWKVWRAVASSLDCDVAALYGQEFATALSTVPATAFVADGSPVVVRRAVRLP